MEYAVKAETDEGKVLILKRGFARMKRQRTSLSRCRFGSEYGSSRLVMKRRGRAAIITRCLRPPTNGRWCSPDFGHRKAVRAHGDQCEIQIKYLFLEPNTIDFQLLTLCMSRIVASVDGHGGRHVSPKTHLGHHRR
jgi:hypothetical protein